MKKMQGILLGILVNGTLAIVIVAVIAILAKQTPKSDRVSIYAPMSHGVSEGYSTIVIDSCEYIESFNRLAHKGNCKFCAERCKKEIQDTEK